MGRSIMVRSKQQTQAQEANYENVARDTLSVSAGKSKEIVSSLAASAGLKEKKASKVAAKVLKKLCAKGVVEKNNNGSFQIVDPSAGKKKKIFQEDQEGLQTQTSSQQAKEEEAFLQAQEEEAYPQTQEGKEVLQENQKTQEEVLQEGKKA